MSGHEERGHRPSGLGPRSRKFFEVIGPDGQPFEVVKARSAATMLCLEEHGEWPKQGFTVFDYDVEFHQGEVIQGEEGRKNRTNIGALTNYLVIQVERRFKHVKGNYSQMRKWVLVQEIADDNDDLNELSARDLKERS